MATQDRKDDELGALLLDQMCMCHRITELSLYEAKFCLIVWFGVITKHAHPLENKSNHTFPFIDICGSNIPSTRPKPSLTLYSQ